MRGSAVNNTKVNANQKIVPCSVCNEPVLVGKFDKKDQKCEKCKNIPKGRNTAVRKLPSKPVVKLPSKPSSFAVALGELAVKLGFEINEKRLWKKKYAIDGGGVATVHIMIDMGLSGQEPRIGYFSLTVQRAVGINDNFRKFMPPDAASDCELLASELGGVEIQKPQIGQEKCDQCGILTDQFGVKGNKVLCIRKGGCFKKAFTSGGAESVE